LRNLEGENTTLGRKWLLFRPLGDSYPQPLGRVYTALSPDTERRWAHRSQWFGSRRPDREGDRIKKHARRRSNQEWNDIVCRRSNTHNPHPEALLPRRRRPAN